MGYQILPAPITQELLYVYQLPASWQANADEPCGMQEVKALGTGLLLGPWNSTESCQIFELFLKEIQLI